LQRRQLDVDEMMLFGGFVEEMLLAALRSGRLERRIKYFLLDLRVRLDLALEIGDESLALFDVARSVELAQQSFRLGVIGFQHRDRIRHTVLLICLHSPYVLRNAYQSTRLNCR